MVPVSYNVRSLLVRKVTTIVTALGIALVVFVFAASRMLTEGVNAAMATSGRPDTVIVLRKGSDNELSSGLPMDAVAKLRAHPQVSQAAGAGAIGELVQVVMAPHEGGSGEVSNVTIRGIPEDGIAFRPEVKITSGRAPKPGTNEVVVGKAIAGRFKGFEIGGTVELRHNRPLSVVGIFDAGGSSYDSEVWCDREFMGQTLGRTGNVSSVRVRLNSASDFEAYRREIEGTANKDFAAKVQREADYYRDQSAQIGTFLKFIGMFFAIMFSLAAMIGAAITMNAAVAHRSREIGTLRALGFGRFSILFSFVFEALLLAVAGGVIGSIAVLGLSFVTFPMMNFQTFSEIVIRFHAAPSVFIWSLVFALVMGLIGGLVPAIRASRVSPVEAMRA
ncbi:MAG TPA: ABC transporter permease [Kofleriaceae bacterium]|jgi:putative ABC transport system permease protein|nr:ABC transporter permease [Kofleriaceae bacterium]